jgi:hypothetical protein
LNGFPTAHSQGDVVVVWLFLLNAVVVQQVADFVRLYEVQVIAPEWVLLR